MCVVCSVGFAKVCVWATQSHGGGMGEAPMAQGWQLVLGVGTDGGGVWAVGGGVGHGPRIGIAWAICS